MKLYNTDMTPMTDRYSIGERIVHINQDKWLKTLSRFTNETLILGPETKDFFIIKLLKNNYITYIYAGDSEEKYTAFSEGAFKIDLFGLVVDEFKVAEEV